MEGRYTVEEYRELDRSSQLVKDPVRAYEYFRGRVFALAGESLPHSLIGDNIHGLLRPHVRQHGCRAFAGTVQVKTNESYVYPDITVVCGEIEITDTSPPSVLNPLFLVEVLSSSTSHRDKTWKLEEYLSLQTLREYWIVSQSEPRIVQYLRTQSGWTMDTAAGLGEILRCGTFDLDVPLAQVYEDVTFEA